MLCNECQCVDFLYYGYLKNHTEQYMGYCNLTLAIKN